MVFVNSFLPICTLIVTKIQYCFDIILILVCYFFIQSVSPMKIMASLKSGVLVKFLEDMKMGCYGNGNDNDNASDDDIKKPILLQIRSIIPVLEEGGDHLCPNRGFYLKVADNSHAMYVCLAEEQNEMILLNMLKLGQFIYVQKLEDSSPFPILRGVTPLPGRRSCDGTPEDIVSVANLGKILGQASNSDCIVHEKGVIFENMIVKIPLNSRKFSSGLSNGKCRKRIRSLSEKLAPDCTVKKFDSGEVRKSKKRSTEPESDTDIISSPLSFHSLNSKRKSWNESEILGVKEIFDSSVVKHVIRPLRSETVSPVRSVICDSSHEHSSTIPKRRRKVVGGSVKKLKSCTKSKDASSKINCDRPSYPVDGLVNRRQGGETGISWDSLPSSMVKLGKEVVKQRDVALVAATDALQEACAAERLLNSLSKFSEFRLAEQDNLQPHVDKFLDLQDDMVQTRLILQSLTNVSPTDAAKEALTIAVKRKKNASTWIKSAVAFDMSPCSTSLNTMKKSNTSNQSTKKPKGAFIIESHQSSADDISSEQSEWSRGSTMPAVNILASSLQNDCRKLFLVYVEKYLDQVEKKTSSMVVDSQIAGMMYKVKRINDWLDVINDKKEGKLHDSELEIWQRARNKIYGILLKHVERTAMAFGSSNSISTIHA